MRRIHHVSLISMRWSILMLAGLFVLLAGMVRIVFPHAPWILELTESLLFIMYAGYNIRGIYISTSPDGIEYHRREFMVAAKWDDVDRITRIQKGYGKGEVLLLRHSSWRVKQKELLFFADPRRIIPLSGFAQPWRQSALGEEIRKYAPHLFTHID